MTDRMNNKPTPTPPLTFDSIVKRNQEIVERVVAEFIRDHLTLDDTPAT